MQKSPLKNEGFRLLSPEFLCWEESFPQFLAMKTRILAEMEGFWSLRHSSLGARVWFLFQTLSASLQMQAATIYESPSTWLTLVLLPW